MSWMNTIITDPNGYAVAVIPWQSPIWSNAAQTAIDVTRHHTVYGDIPFTCDPNDTGADFDTAQLFEAIKASGEAIAPYVDPVATP